MKLVVRVDGDGASPRLRYEVDSPLEEVHASRRPFGEVTLRRPPESFQRRLVRDMGDLVLGDGPSQGPLRSDEIVQLLRARGHDLFLELVPPALQRFLIDLPASVESFLVVSDEPWIPWEILAVPGGEILSQRFRLTRWLAGSPAPPRRLGVRRVACVTGGNAKRGKVKPGVEHTLLADLAAAHGATFEAPPTPDIGEVRRLLERGFDLLHFAGHGKASSESPMQAAFLLQDNQRLRALDLLGPLGEVIARHRTLVFLNACEGGQQAWNLVNAGGWATALVQRSAAGAFVGPHWVVRDSCAAVFADVFYRALSAGETLGEAARRARRELWRRGDAVEALAYAVYGHSNARVVWQTED